MEENNNNVTGARKVCTEAMVAEVVADLIAEGNVSRVDGKTPTIASISARIFERYDGLTPSGSTLTRLRDKIMAERQPVVSGQVKATPATLPSELMDVLDQHARQAQIMLGQLANVLADVLQRTSDDLAGKLRVAVEQTKQDASQSAAVAEEEVAAALAQNGQLREQVARLIAELETAKAEVATERARAATFEQVNTALLAQLATTNAPVSIDHPATEVDQNQTDEQPSEASINGTSIDGMSVADTPLNTVRSCKGRRTPKTLSTEQEAA
ncbi:hypothetical protein [Trichlorobacter lovleyi]|uniref:hypothetical protein n=1 Tax=Trichlorobacter lovleyi TaxID=313985 RepID=UPI003D0D7414